MKPRRKTNYVELLIVLLVIGAIVGLILSEKYFSNIVFNFLIGEKSIASTPFGNQAFFGFGILFLVFSIPYVLKHWFSKFLFVLSLVVICIGLTHSFGVTNSGVYFLNYNNPITPQIYTYNNIDKVLIDADIWTSQKRGVSTSCRTVFYITFLSKSIQSKQVYLQGNYDFVHALSLKLREHNIPVVLSKNLNCVLEEEQNSVLRRIQDSVNS